MVLVFLSLFLPTQAATHRGIHTAFESCQVSYLFFLVIILFEPFAYRTRRCRSNTLHITTPRIHTTAPKTQNTHVHIDTVPATTRSACIQRLSSRTSLLTLYHLCTSVLEPPTTSVRVCTSLSSHCARVPTSPLRLTLTLRRHTSIQVHQPPSPRRTHHQALRLFSLSLTIN